MSDYKDRAAVVGKVEWEGGILGALDYGLRAEHLPENDTELRQAWAALEAKYLEMTPLVDAVEKLLEAAADDTGSEFD